MKLHICFCCHIVRNCKGCCHSCKSECGMRHFCEIHDRHMTETQGWEWYYNVTLAISPELARKAIPDWLWQKMRKIREEPVQLKIDFKRYEQ